MPGVFICYRRDDGRHAAGRLYDHLVDKFGEAGVFRDIDTLVAGDEWRAAIVERISQCDAVVVLVGRKWLERGADGRRRLDNPEDPVRFEIITALEHGVKILPAGIDGADMPAAGDLPEPLQDLVRFHALQLTDSHFRQDAARLVDAIDRARASAARGSALLVVKPCAPDAPSHFQDREREVRLLDECLADRELRVVWVYGRGGTGKSALVSKLIQGLRAATPPRSVDSVVYIEFGSEVNRSAGRIVECLADTLHPRAREELLAAWQQRRDTAEGLKSVFGSALTGGRCLIVLDNFESVLDARGRIRDDCSELRTFVEEALLYSHTALVLVVTRYRPVFPPEVEGRTKRRTRELSLEAGLPPEAANALLQALDAGDECGFRSAPRELIDGLVTSCGCIPRTLEAIYGYLCLHPTQRISSLILDTRRFQSLVEAPFRELYEGLPEDMHRRIVQALSVYGCPVPAGALAAVLPEAGEHEIADGLNMLVRNHVAGMDGDAYSLHPLDREYAYGRISTGGKQASLQLLEERAASWYLAGARQESACFDYRDVEPRLAAFHHLVRAAKYDDACRVLNGIDREHLAQWGYHEQIIEMRSQLLDRIADSCLRGLNLGNLGTANFERGDTDRAIQLYEQALASARECGTRADEGRWTGNLGLAFSRMGDQAKATALVEEALAIARETGDVRHQGRWLGNLGLLQEAQGRADEALRLFGEAVPLTREAGDWRFEKLWLTALAEWYVSQRDVGAAAEIFEQAAGVARRVHLTMEAVRLLARAATVFLEAGDTEKAAAFYEKALEVAREGSDERSAAAQAQLLAAVAQVTGDDPGRRPKVTEYLRQAASIVHGLGDYAAEVALLQSCAEILAAMGEPGEAVATYQRALELVREHLEDRALECSILNSVGAAHEITRNLLPAIEYYKASLAVARELGDREAESIALHNVGGAMDMMGDTEGALPYYRESLAIESVTTDYKASMGLGIGLLKLGKREEAQPYLIRCADLCQERIGAKTKLHPLMSARAMALMALGRTKEGLAVLGEGLSRSLSEHHRQYALEDLFLLGRAVPSLPGLEEALAILEGR